MFVSDFCIIFHIRESPWSPQIRVGSVGTMEGWPRVQASSSQGEVKVLEERAGSYWHRNVNESAVSWCKIAEFSGCHLQLGMERQPKVIMTFQEKGHLRVLEWVQASELSLEVKCFRNLCVTLQSSSFSFSCLVITVQWWHWNILIAVSKSTIYKSNKKKSGNFWFM